MVDDEEVYAYLEHFGVKGMHWGIRNDKEKKARREAKAQKHQKRADRLQTRIDKKSRWENQADLRKARDTELKNVKRAKEGKLTSGQRQLVIGASAAAAILAAYGAYQTVQSGNGRRLIGKGKDYIQGNKGVPFKVKPELRAPMSPDEIYEKVVRPINPGYGELGTKMNCRRATYAYELRRRGYDVAATRTTNARGQDITGMFNATRPNVNLVPPGRGGMMTRLYSEMIKSKVKPGTPKPFTDLITTPGAPLGQRTFNRVSTHGGDLIRALSENPDGARGELSVQWLSGGLHSVAWEKINGQVVVFDNQTGKRYSGINLTAFTKGLAQSGFTRLDDKPLNADFLRRWVKNSSGELAQRVVSPGPTELDLGGLNFDIDAMRKVLTERLKVVQ